MCMGIVIILLAFVGLACAKEQMAKDTMSVEGSTKNFFARIQMDKLADAFFDQLMFAGSQLGQANANSPSQHKPLERGRFFVPWNEDGVGLHGVSPRSDASMEPRKPGSDEVARARGLRRFLQWSRGSQAKVRKPARGLKVVPFKRQRPSIDMDKTVEKALTEKGEFRTQQVIGNIAKAQGVMDIQASPKVIWNQLFDFPSYPKKVPVACAADIYRPSQSKEDMKVSHFNLDKLPFAELLFPQLPFSGGNHLQSIAPRLGGTQKMFVKFQSPVLPGIKVTAYCDLTYEPSKNSVTWQLDREKTGNDFDNVQGHWHVAPHPDDSSKARVFYEMAGTVPRVIPPPLVKVVGRYVVKDATQWLKKESEREAASEPEQEKGVWQDKHLLTQWR